jgi:putative protein kinase ArgK-like GTPase of G3E family
MILNKIMEWIDLKIGIMGCAGTGKSVLINTFVAHIRRTFKTNISVIVTAPTGVVFII